MEKDNNFEILIDPVVFAWNVDPLTSEFSSWSPYAAFNDNPILNIDPDGRASVNSLDGYKDLQGNYKWFDEEKGDVAFKDNKLWLKVSDDRAIFDLTASGAMDNIPKSSSSSGVIKPYKPNVFSTAKEILNSPSLTTSEASGKFALAIVYGVADDLMVYGSNLISGSSGAKHLDNSLANNNEITNSGVNTITTFTPMGSFGKSIGIGKQALNAAKFSTLFKGESVLKGTAQLRGLNNLKYNQTIRLNNSFNTNFSIFNNSSLLLNSKSSTNLNIGSDTSNSNK